MARVDGPIHDERARKLWAFNHGCCQICGKPAWKAALDIVGLTVHHLMKPGRSDEPCNLIMACHPCHDAAELRTVRVAGVLLPPISWEAGLSIKLFRDPEEFSTERITALMGRAWTVERVPAWYEQHYRRHRPRDLAHFIPDEWLI